MDRWTNGPEQRLGHLKRNALPISEFAGAADRTRFVNPAADRMIVRALTETLGIGR
jgi:hypothetical protein